MIAIKAGYESTYREIMNVPLETPRDAGQWWKGISHGEFLGGIMDECQSRAWTSSNMKLFMSPDEYDIAGTFQVNVPGFTPPDGQDLCMGFIHSNTRRRAIKISAGVNVRVCMNGLVTGQVVLRHKHTRNFDFQTALVESFNLYESEIEKIPEMIARWKATELSDNQVNELLIRAGRQKLMPWSRIGLVDSEYLKPTHSHFEPTAWNLLQAFTMVVKQNPPLSQMDQVNGFREMLPSKTMAI